MTYLSSKKCFQSYKIFFCNINVSAFIKDIEANNKLSEIDIMSF